MITHPSFKMLPIISRSMRSVSLNGCLKRLQLTWHVNGCSCFSSWFPSTTILTNELFLFLFTVDSCRCNCLPRHSCRRSRSAKHGQLGHHLLYRGQYSDDPSLLFVKVFFFLFMNWYSLLSMQLLIYFDNTPTFTWLPFLTKSRVKTCISKSHLTYYCMFTFHVQEEEEFWEKV